MEHTYTAHTICASMPLLLFIPTLFILTDKLSTVGKFWRGCITYT